MNGADSYRRYLDGDDSGLAEIVEAYKDGLILFLNGYVKNIHTAEELAEDAFFRLITRKPRFSGKSSFQSWLYAIGRHIAVDDLRRSARLADAPAEALEAFRSDEEGLEAAYIRGERQRLVRGALEKLHPDYRQALWLTYFEGFSGAEAGAVLGKNERQMRNLLYRAKQALKAELQREGFEYDEEQ